MTGSSETWRAASCLVRGESHRRRGIPCQDRAASWLSPRPALCVLDGRGSAPLSHFGARYGLHVVKKLIRETESEIAAILDGDGDALAALGWHGFSHRLYHAAALTQVVLGTRHRRSPEEFESTLSVAVLGRLRVGWFAVGDSPLVACKYGICGLIAEPEIQEFANMSTFVVSTPPPPPVCRSGIIPADGLQGIAAMSDGAASRLIHLAAHVPSPAICEIMSRVADGKWTSHDLRHALQDPEWNLATGDDRSMALVALPPPVLIKPPDADRPSVTTTKA